MKIRTGIGFDAHRLVAGRRLVMGGVQIEHPLGLAGHSDADVLCHAVADALLGAAGLEDIGHYFPDTDPAFKDASSLALLGQVRDLVTQGGCRIGNVDVVVVAEAPRIAPYRQPLRESLAGALGISAADIGVRGTTTEGMGFTGRGEGIAAMATCLLECGE
ncbi:MAG: 2-C-methyl-D-erythritol 2,4-cyclodiphosphate synthase [Thermoleophilia bacterium]